MDTFKPAHEVSIHGCARCGGHHDQLTVKPFINPPSICTHWALCPATGEPLFWRQDEVTTTPADAPQA
jgi:hypothetical protein